jgi:hypothetical protein
MHSGDHPEILAKDERAGKRESREVITLPFGMKALIIPNGSG